MTTKTITYDDAKWQLVPKVSTEEIWSAINDARCSNINCSELYDAAVAAATSPPEQFCEWELCEGSNVHATGCGELAHTVTRYCHNCGKPIKKVGE